MDQVVRSWKEKGLLTHDKDKNTLTRVFEPGMTKIPMYAIKVVELTTPLSAGSNVANQSAQGQSAAVSEPDTAVASGVDADTEHRRPIALRKGEGKNVSGVDEAELATFFDPDEDVVA